MLRILTIMDFILDSMLVRLLLIEDALKLAVFTRIAMGCNPTAQGNPPHQSMVICTLLSMMAPAMAWRVRPAVSTPISPPSGPSQWPFQEPPAESKLLAAFTHGKKRGVNSGERPHLRPSVQSAIYRVMKINSSIKPLVALLASLAMVATQADAKPGAGKGGKGGKGKGENDHSQKANHDKGPDHPGKAADKGDKKSEAVQFARFKDNERKEILDYFGRYRTQGEGLPPGLAMNQRRGKPLPPGWQKKLVPGYRIDDNEWSNYAPVPSEWFPNQRMEPNTRLYYHGDRVIRVYEPRREVIDVLTLSFGR